MTDLISRQTAIDEVKTYLFELIEAVPRKTDEDGNEYYADTTVVNFLLKVNKELRGRLSALLTIDPVKHGKWKEINLADYKALCSQCGTWSPIIGRFCPYCGAKMDVSDNDVGKMNEVEE